MRRILPFLVLLLTANTIFAQQFKPFDAAQAFNVFVLNDLTAVGGDTHGPVAMGNNLILQGNTIFTMNHSGKFPTGVLNDNDNFGMVIGNRVFYNSGNQTQVNRGMLRIGNSTGSTIWYRDNNDNATNLKLTSASGSFSSNPSVILQRQQATGSASVASGINFTSAFSSLVSAANKMNSWKLSSSVQLNKITIANEQNPHITLSSNRINYISLTGSELNDLFNRGSLIFDNKPTEGGPLVVNVDAAGAFSWTPPNAGGLSESDGAFIIWNFYNTTSLQLNGSNNIYGSVSAPWADVVKNNPNNLNGQVIASSLSINSGEIHYYPFITSRPDVPAASPLAISSINLTATVLSNNVKLNWQPNDESNVQLYTIEYSTDGTVFTPVSTTSPSGGSGRNTYTFTHTNAAGTFAYYRVKAQEQNGRIVYSGIIGVKLKGGTAFETWPNPVTDQLSVRISGTQVQTIRWTMTTANGQEIKRGTQVLTQGSNQFMITGLGSLSKGAYWISIYTENNTVMMSKCIVK